LAARSPALNVAFPITVWTLVWRSVRY